MSSHREAPEISKDPVADNTDVYAFVSPDDHDKVTLIANFIPFQNPQGGPNFYEFGDDVSYAIHISNRGKSEPDITYRFQFHTHIRNRDTFLYNTGQIKHIDDTTWNRPQYLRVTRIDHTGTHLLARGLTVPPVNVGPRSTPDYDHFTAAAIHKIGNGRTVFAGQRAEGFYVDLGSIFDLGTLRPFEHLHLIPSADAVGVNGDQGLNVHSIAIQVPKTDLTVGHKDPSKETDAHSVIGVWSSTSRRSARIYNPDKHTYEGHGPWQQVSRLGNPLFNEVIVPMAHKDEWNTDHPSGDKAYAKYVAHPELAKLLPVLYPNVFPHLAKYTKERKDLEAILLTGIPAGIVQGFQNTTGPVLSDMLRLNMAIKPASNPSRYGLIGGDASGFPNGRRPMDDIVAIELRAIAGATIPLVDPSYKPDGAASQLTDGTKNTNAPYLKHFPYLGTPAGGYQTTPGTPKT